jgi:hypothetical protein
MPHNIRKQTLTGALSLHARVHAECLRTHITVLIHEGQGRIPPLKKVVQCGTNQWAQEPSFSPGFRDAWGRIIGNQQSPWDLQV